MLRIYGFGLYALHGTGGGLNTFYSQLQLYYYTHAILGTHIFFPFNCAPLCNVWAQGVSTSRQPQVLTHN